MLPSVSRCCEGAEVGASEPSRLRRPGNLQPSPCQPSVSICVASPSSSCAALGPSEPPERRLVLVTAQGRRKNGLISERWVSPNPLPRGVSFLMNVSQCLGLSAPRSSASARCSWGFRRGSQC